jgi:DNA processing protein
MQISAENLAKLQLIRSPNLGAVSVRRLLLRYATAQNALENFTAWRRKDQPLATLTSVQNEVTALQALGGWMVFYGDAEYPAALHDLPDGPVVLSGLGARATLQRTQVAIVGNRAASAAGLAWSRNTAYALAAAEVVVTSGLARGVDTAVHEGALLGAPGGAPCTVAVVAGGVDHIYPPENAKLRERIIAQGCVISEQPLGMQPIANLFPQRNRIIAGLSVGVVVSEATRHSGSLITAEYALNYGREVWAVPGSPTEARSGGPNWLLKNGASLIENAAEIISQMPRTPAPYVPPVRAQPTLFSAALEEAASEEAAASTADDEAPLSERTRLFALLSTAPVTFDALVRQTGFTEAEISALLTELELEGHAVREADGRWRRG